MLTTAQIDRLRIALYEEDASSRRASIAQLATAEELHAFASHYNWDDGAEDLRAVIENPACDRGTALMLYWRTDGIFYKLTSEVWAHEAEIYALALEIERRFLAGFYRGQQIRFDPRDPDDGGWALVPSSTYGSREVPAEMLLATQGERPENVMV